MEVKEAIEWIRNIPKINLYIGTKKEDKGKILFTNGIKDCTEEEYYKDINDIISLLQQGDKYRQMWEEFRRYRGDVWNNNSGEYVRELMEKYEEKYFPKEAKQDEN